MRTDEEIIEKVTELEENQEDFLGFQRTDLLCFLSIEAIERYLGKELPADARAVWTNLSRDDDAIKTMMRDYMPFAWEKANDCRSISATRSIQHMQVWLWMMGQDEAAKSIAEYTMYGKPQLRAVSEYIGFDWRAADNGKWRDDEREPGDTPDAVPLVELPLVGNENRA